jgi:hypothetical protein
MIPNPPCRSVRVALSLEETFAVQPSQRQQQVRVHDTLTRNGTKHRVR